MDNFNKIRSACKSAEPDREKIRNSVLGGPEKKSSPAWATAALCCVLAVFMIGAVILLPPLLKKAEVTGGELGEEIANDEYFLLPGFISAPTMEEKILSKITEQSDKDKLLAFYIASDNFYSLDYSISCREAAYLESIVKKYCPGYDFSELLKDCGVGNLVSKTEEFFKAEMIYDLLNKPIISAISLIVADRKITLKEDGSYRLYSEDEIISDGVMQLALSDINGDGTDDLCMCVTEGADRAIEYIKVFDMVQERELFRLFGRQDGIRYTLYVDGEGLLCVEVTGEKGDVTHGKLSVRDGKIRLAYDDENKYKITYSLGDLADLFVTMPEWADAGENVTIVTEIITDGDIHVYADGTEIPKTSGDGRWSFTFVMPEKNVKITAKSDLSVRLDEVRESFLNYMKKEHPYVVEEMGWRSADDIEIQTLVGSKFESGCIVAYMVDGLLYTEALRTVVLGEGKVSITFRSGQICYVFKDGEVLTVSEAFNKGYLTESDIAFIDEKIGVRENVPRSDKDITIEEKKGVDENGEEAIKAAFFEYMKKEHPLNVKDMGWKTFNDVEIQEILLGAEESDNGCAVAYMTDGREYFEDKKTADCGAAMIILPNWQTCYAFYGDEVTDVKTAFNNGYLTADDIAKAFKNAPSFSGYEETITWYKKTDEEIFRMEVTDVLCVIVYPMAKNEYYCTIAAEDFNTSYASDVRCADEIPFDRLVPAKAMNYILEWYEQNGLDASKIIIEPQSGHVMGNYSEILSADLVISTYSGLFSGKYKVDYVDDIR